MPEDTKIMQEKHNWNLYNFAMYDIYRELFRLHNVQNYKINLWYRYFFGPFFQIRFQAGRGAKSRTSFGVKPCKNVCLNSEKAIRYSYGNVVSSYKAWPI